MQTRPNSPSLLTKVKDPLPKEKLASMLKGVKERVQSKLVSIIATFRRLYITLRTPDLNYIIYDGCTLYWHAYDHAYSCIQSISKRLLVALIKCIVAFPEH